MALVKLTDTQWISRRLLAARSLLGVTQQEFATGVFPNGNGNIENHSNIHNRVLVPLLVENGIVGVDGKPKFSFHALRHAAASLFIEQNWPPKKIQSLLGHSSINMTMDVYGHLFESPEDDVELFAKLEDDLMAA